VSETRIRAIKTMFRGRRRHLAKALAAVLGLNLAMPAAASGAGASNLLQVGFLRGSFAESYLEQETESRLGARDQYLLLWDAELNPTDRLWMRLARSTYQLDDRDFPGTLHRRQETGLVVGARRSFALPTGGLRLGLGYSLDVMQVENSARIPGDDPGFLFVPWQAYHGPTVLGDYRAELFGPLGVSLDAEWVPFVFANLADTRLPMPAYLTAFRIAPRVTLWGERLSVGYVYERTLGAGYDRGTSGVFAMLSLLGI
jgi:hypothetical protein